MNLTKCKVIDICHIGCTPVINSYLCFRFGVCCVFMINDATTTQVNYNNTYLQNPGFPSTYSETTGITYTVAKVNEGKTNSEHIIIDVGKSSAGMPQLFVIFFLFSISDVCFLR